MGKKDDMEIVQDALQALGEVAKMLRKYEDKKKEEQIVRVGDEVKISGLRGVVIGVRGVALTCQILFCNGRVKYGYDLGELPKFKTGRYYPQIELICTMMRKQEELLERTE